MKYGYSSLFLPISVLLVLVFAGLCHLSALSSDWHFDDFGHINNNPAVHAKELSPGALKRAALGSPLKTRPLSYITFALDHIRAGPSSRAFHQTSLALHLFSTLMAFVLLLKVYTLRPIAGKVPWPRAAALLGALVFAVNPVQVQAVAYAVQRMTLLSGLFVLAGMYAWAVMRYGHKKSATGNALLWTGFFIAVLAGMLSKETAFAVIPLVLVFDRCVHGEGFAAWLSSRKTLISLMIAAGVATGAAYLFLSGYSAGGQVLSGYEHREFTLVERLLTQSRVILWYVGLWVFPSPARLSIDHMVIKSTGLVSPWWTFPALAIAAGLTVAALWRAHRAPLICFGWLWFAAGLALESSVLPLEMAFEHRLYLPSLGLVMTATGLLSRFNPGRRAVLPILLAAAFLGILSFSRGRDWDNMLVLWQDAAMKAPEKSRPWTNLCTAFFVEARHEKAMESCRRAISIDRDNSRAYYNLGLALEKSGRFREAEEIHEKAVELDPEKAEAFYRLGVIRRARGELHKSKESLQKAVDLVPDDPLYWYHLGLTSRELGSSGESRRALLRARDLAKPGSELLRKINQSL